MDLSPMASASRRVRQGSFVAALVGSTMLTALPALADVNLDEPTRVNDVVVTAAGREQQVKDAPASISVINRETLERAPYGQVTDVLVDIPGVTITPGEGNTRDISIRGMGSSYTLLLIDGRRVNSRESRTNGGNISESGMMPPLEAIERVEVVRGPMSSLYGSDAMGGVVNIITRKVADEWGGSVRVNGTFQTADGYSDFHDASVFASGPLVEGRLGLQITGSMNRRDEDNIAYGSPLREDGSIAAKLGWQINPAQSLTFEAGYYNQFTEQTSGKSGAVSSTNPEGTVSTQEHTRAVYALVHQGEFGDVRANSYLQYEDAEGKESGITIRNTVAQTSWIIPWGNHIVNVGGYYSFADLKAPTGNRLEVDGKIRDAADSTQYALFVEDEWSMTDQFALTLGLRMDSHDLYGEHFTPRVYGVWKPTGKLIVKGGVSAGFRAPDIRQTLPDWGQNSRGGTIYGNPDLEAETSLTYEAAIHYGERGGLELGLAIYQTDFNDKITRITCAEGGAWCVDEPLSSIGRPPTTYVNVDEVRIRGAEATLNMPLNDYISLAATATLTDSEQLTGENKGAALNETPEYQLSAGLNFRPEGSRLSGYIRAVRYGEEQQAALAISASNIIAPAYTSVDVGASYEVNERVTIRGGIRNLFDHEMTYEDYGYINDRARVWTGLSARF